MAEQSFMEIYKKYILPFVALLILGFLIATVILLVKDHKIKQKIIENCGWSGEDYRCYCEKTDVINIEMMLNNTLEIQDVKLGG